MPRHKTAQTKTAQTKKAKPKPPSDDQIDKAKRKQLQRWAQRYDISGAQTNVALQTQLKEKVKKKRAASTVVGNSGRNPSSRKKVVTAKGKANKKATTKKSTKKKKKGNETVEAPANERRERRGRKDRSFRTIQHYQKSGKDKFYYPKLTFQRYIRHLVVSDENTEVCQLTGTALLALQEALERYLLHHLENANIMAYHANRVTVMEKDMDVCRRISHYVEAL